MNEDKVRSFVHEVNRVLSDNVGFYQSGPPTRSTFSWVDHREGQSVPAWKTKIRLGQDASSDFFATRHSIDAKKGHYVRTRVQDVSNPYITETREVNGHLFSMPPSGVENIDWSAADNDARSKLYKKIRETQVKMSGQVFLGELGEAMRMLRSPARALRDELGHYLDTLKRGKSRYPKSRDRARFASETWLETQFGLLPLVGDIQDAAKAVSHVINRFERARVAATSETEQASTSSTLVYPLGTLEDECMSNTVTKTKAKVIWRAGLKSSTVGMDTAQLVQSSFGLTVREFVPTAWELLPMSFVADYFSNVGDILSAYATDTSSVIWSNRTVIIETVRTNSTMIRPDVVKAVIGANFRSCRGSPSSYTAESKQVTRSAIGLSAPSLTVTYPGAGSLKWINLAALAHVQRGLLPFW